MIDRPSRNPANVDPRCAICSHREELLYETETKIYVCWDCATASQRKYATTIRTGYKKTWQEIHNVPAPRLTS